MLVQFLCFFFQISPSPLLLCLLLPVPPFLLQMILTVYLSDGEQAATEVPITPETTCRDVVEFCKEPGEGSCHLAEVWRGNGERGTPRLHGYCVMAAGCYTTQCLLLCGSVALVTDS